MQKLITKEKTVFKEISYSKDIYPKIKDKKQRLVQQCYNINYLNDYDIKILEMIVKKYKQIKKKSRLTIPSEIIPLFNLIEDCVSEIHKNNISYCFNIKQAQMINYCCRALHIDVNFIVEFDSQEILRISNYLYSNSDIINFIEKQLKIDYIKIKPVSKK